MSIVAGVDFGTLSVRVSLFDSVKGKLGAGAAEYPLLRKKEDPDHATQSHADHMKALTAAMHSAVAAAGIDGTAIEAIALDTTGSTIIPVDDQLQPIDDYYLWCDHRAWKEAAEITAAAHSQKLEAINWCGGIYSSEWGWAKLLHWLRNNPDKRDRWATVLEHCDMVAAVLCGIRQVSDVPRSGLRHGSQVDVERSARRSAVRRVPDLGRSPAGRSARQVGRTLRDFRQDRRTPFGRMGRETWAARRHSHSGGAPSTRTGTPSAQVWAWAMWST